MKRPRFESFIPYLIVAIELLKKKKKKGINAMNKINCSKMN